MQTIVTLPSGHAFTLAPEVGGYYCECPGLKLDASPWDGFRRCNYRECGNGIDFVAMTVRGNFNRAMRDDWKHNAKHSSGRLTITGTSTLVTSADKGNDHIE